MQDTSPKEVIIVCRRVCPSKRLCRTEQHCSPQSSGEIVRQLLSRTRREYMCFVTWPHRWSRRVHSLKVKGQGLPPALSIICNYPKLAPGTRSGGSSTNFA